MNWWLWFIEGILAWSLCGICALILGMGHAYYYSLFEVKWDSHNRDVMILCAMCGPFGLYCVIRGTCQEDQGWGWRLPPTKEEIMLHKLEN